MNRFICIHGHFYQPPRENAWLEDVERQDSAAPFHDWNQRIAEECYAPNAAARILNEHGQITDIVNNYTRMSFNFGPTLLRWMQEHKPEVYHDIIRSDAQSQKRFSGHGGAIAQCYNHMIMPLANRRDKETQIRWGIRDFQKRFGRDPEGIWLPETAVDTETLEMLAAQGIRFTILAPRQARRVRRIGEAEWRDVSGEHVDPQRVYRYALPSGKHIALFFYDGPVAKDVAFRGLLTDGKTFFDRLMSLFRPENGPRLVHIATDGESYGHHHRFGEMALAFCLDRVEKNPDVTLTVYAEFLEKFPPEDEVEIFEHSSWSCVHGVERWRENCGCNSGMHPGWHQQWRRPLREALDWLRDQLISVYETEAAPLLTDAWQARNDYIDLVLDRSEDNRNRFLKEHAAHELSAQERIRTLSLLEMQRNAMLMYTSCGWFFDEVSGIETIQIMQYAAKAIQSAKTMMGMDLLPEFLERLKAVPSNVDKYGNAAVVFKTFVQPATVDMERVAAHYAMTSLFEDYRKDLRVYCFPIHADSYEIFKKDDERMAIGRIKVFSEITTEQGEFSFVVLYFGGHDLYAGISGTLSERDFFKLKNQLSRSFLGVRNRSALRILRRGFEYGPFSLKHLFRDEQARILYQMLDTSLFEVERSLREIHDHHYPIMQVIKQLRMPLPKVLANTILVMVNTDFLNVLSSDSIDFKRLSDLVDEVKEWDLDVDRVTLEFFVSRRMKTLMEQFQARPKQQKSLRTMNMMLKALEPLRLHFDVGKCQNIYFSLFKEQYPEFKKKGEAGQAFSKNWAEMFEELGVRLNMVIISKLGVK